MGNMITVTRKKRNYNTHLLKQGVVRVGFFPQSRYEGNDSKSGLSVAQVARFNEFGLGVPKRPFMRPAVFEHKADLTNNLHKRYRQAIRDNQDTMMVLENFGKDVAGLIREQIANTNEPPNAPSTIKRKGANTPLRDTRLMLNSVSYQAEERAKR